MSDKLKLIAKLEREYTALVNEGRSETKEGVKLISRINALYESIRKADAKKRANA